MPPKTNNYLRDPFFYQYRVTQETLEKLREEISASSKLFGHPLEKIRRLRFSDGWYMVKPGTVVLSPDGRFCTFDSKHDGSEQVTFRTSILQGVEAAR